MSQKSLKSGRKAITATCHPGRERFTKDGECLPCYRAAGGPPLRMADCHRSRRHFGKGLCRSCYMVRWNKEHPDSNSGNGWLKNNPERARLHIRKYSLKRLGLTIEQYESMWKAQSGKCANHRCRYTAPKILPDHRVGLQVDHDHKTGAIRGLLCAMCNLALGHAHDSAGTLRGLIEYIETHSLTEN